MPFPSGQVAIVGVYLTDQGKLPDRTSESLCVEAFKGALDDAGLTPGDVDAVSPAGGLMQAGWWAHQLDKTIVMAGSGAMGAAGVTEAAAFINAGLAEVVVLICGQAGSRLGPGSQSAAVTARSPRVSEWNPAPWGMFMSAWYAQMAQRYLHVFGATSEQLAEVSVTFRKHATLNPRSVMGVRGEITVDDVMGSRMIATPLHLLECCLDNDGGYAIVVTSTERARSLKKKPVLVLGGATALWNTPYEEFNDEYWPSPASVTGPKAMAQAGVKHDDFDVLGIYDCFTITVARLMEDLGFCKLGEGADYVGGGRLGLGGEFPTNLDGGLLSHSHNGNPSGLHLIEVVRQLRGEVEPERQVEDPKIGFVHGQGAAVLGRHGSCVLAID